MRSIAVCLTVAALGAASLGPVSASTDKLNLLNLSRLAKFAVLARVADFQTCPSESGGIFTYVTFEEVKTLQKEGGKRTKEPPEHLTLRVPGGMVDGRVEIVSDAPIFRQGDQVVLFLTRDPQQQVPIVQSANGVLFVDNRDLMRASRGPHLVEIEKDFDVVLDPAYEPKPEDLRHWDPNMVAVFKRTEPDDGLGQAPLPQRFGEPMTLDVFTGHLERAWRQADRMGRLPEKLDFSPRRADGETPVSPPDR